MRVHLKIRIYLHSSLVTEDFWLLVDISKNKKIWYDNISNGQNLEYENIECQTLKLTQTCFKNYLFSKCLRTKNSLFINNFPYPKYSRTSSQKIQKY